MTGHYLAGRLRPVGVRAFTGDRFGGSPEAGDAASAGPLARRAVACHCRADRVAKLRFGRILHHVIAELTLLELAPPVRSARSSALYSADHVRRQYAAFGSRVGLGSGRLAVCQKSQ